MRNDPLYVIGESFYYLIIIWRLIGIGGDSREKPAGNFMIDRLPLSDPYLKNRRIRMGRRRRQKQFPYRASVWLL